MCCEEILSPHVPPPNPTPSLDQGWEGKGAAGRDGLAAWVAGPGLPGSATGSRRVDPLPCFPPQSPPTACTGAKGSEKETPPQVPQEKGFLPRYRVAGERKLLSQHSCRCPLESSQHFTQFSSTNLPAQRSGPPRAYQFRFSREKNLGGPHRRLAPLPTGYFPLGKTTQNRTLVPRTQLPPVGPVSKSFRTSCVSVVHGGTRKTPLTQGKLGHFHKKRNFRFVFQKQN